MRNRIGGIVALVSILLGMPMIAFAKVKMPENAPVDRLITNMDHYVKEHPKDAEGYLLLGRLHAFSFASTEKTISIYLNKNNKNVLPSFPYGQRLAIDVETRGRKARRQHLLLSIKNYETAANLFPDYALPVLEMAWMLEQGSLMGKDAGECPVDKGKTDWHSAALVYYKKSYDMRAKKDLAEHSYGFPIAREAAEGTLRLWKDKQLTNEEKNRKKEYGAFLKAVSKVSLSISPIIFPLQCRASLASLLDNKKRVGFDIAGDSVPRKWHWVKPSTGILVWDPKHQGNIKSGRQLFGTRSWNIFWKDGYRALDALDDNHDGVLSRTELEGISVWIDRNGNGRSDPGEVIPVQKLGITQIATRSQGRREGALWNPNGIIRLRDGREVPTYDWTPRSL